MSLKGQVQDDVKGAMKSGDKDRLKVLRLVMAAIKQIEVDQRIELDDDAVLDVLNKMVKQRRDSVAQFDAGGRKDLSAIEKDEISVLADYMPEQLSDTEIDALIAQAISDTGAQSLREMGKVMGLLKASTAGRADMGQVSSRVKAQLG